MAKSNGTLLVALAAEAGGPVAQKGLADALPVRHLLPRRSPLGRRPALLIYEFDIALVDLLYMTFSMVGVANCVRG